jgi:hypothetical protein
LGTISAKTSPARGFGAIGREGAIGERDTMVRCSCCEEMVDAVIEVPRTKQLVCARCLGIIRGMLAVWDVLATTKERKKQGAA